MESLRRLVSPLAVLLALVVAGATTDLVPCVDADCSAWSLVLGDIRPTPDNGPSGCADVACFCHLSFVPAAAVQGVPAPTASSRLLPSAVLTGVSAGPSDVPHPPPLV